MQARLQKEFVLCPDQSTVFRPPTTNEPIMNHVPFADLHAQYLTIKDEIDEAIAAVIRQSAFVRGPFVERFEQQYADLMDAEHCVSCADGTAALYIAMHALDIKPGDEVITTAQSWISTSETVSQHGAVPVFVDIDPDTHTLSPSLVEEKITSRTVGIIPVHLYGQPADMDPIMEIARRHGLWVIEDCAQAHLAEYKGRKVGRFGNAATWSFYPGKNLGAFGDAGAITTDDAALARKMARFARHGGIVKGVHEIEGINSRLDGLQAAILSVKLPHLPTWTKARQAIAESYSRLLSGASGTKPPHVRRDGEHVFHLYVVQSDRRDELSAHLKAQGIQTVINYPTALPFLPAYDRFKYSPADFPAAYANQGRILSLPIFAEMTEEQVGQVAGAIHGFNAPGT
jgi:dTDP-4-amino-4,6-dideoxygalactose transaminase